MVWEVVPYERKGASRDLLVSKWPEGFADLETLQELRNCPMGKERLYGMKGSVERKTLLKEMLYCRKGQNCPNISKLSVVYKLSALCTLCALSLLSALIALSALSTLFALSALSVSSVLSALFVLSVLSVLSQLTALSALSSILWNLVAIVKFGRDCEIRLQLWNWVAIVKFCCNCQID